MQTKFNSVTGQIKSWRNSFMAVVVALFGLTTAQSATAADGRIVVSHDEWILSNDGFTIQPVGTANYTRNLANWLTAGKPNAKILAYSQNFAFTGTQLRDTMTGAGYDWVVSVTVPTDLASLMQYDAIYLGGSFLDNTTLINYVRAGGNVYVTAGTGLNYPDEAGAWNPFLNTFGLRYINGNPIDGIGNDYNHIGGSIPVTSNHPIFNSPGSVVTMLYHNNGNTVEEISPTNVKTAVLQEYLGRGLFAVYDPASTADEVSIDAMPGLYPNLLSTVRYASVTAIAISGTASRNVSLINAASIRVRGLAPLSNVVADVSSPYGPNVGRTDPNGGVASHPDGINDLVLYFDTAALLNTLTPVTDGAAVSVTLTGTYNAGGAFVGDDLLVTVTRTPGSIIVGYDDWVFSDLGQTLASDSTKLLQSISTYFAGGSSGGNFLYYSVGIPYTASFVNVLTAAGHTATPLTAALPPGSVQDLLQYDGIFLGGNFDDTASLINYVMAGGNVYICGGMSFDANDGQFYNQFLNYFGLSLGSTHSSLALVNPVASTNVLFAGVNALYSLRGSTMSVLNLANPETIELARAAGELAFIMYKPLGNRSPIVGPDSVSTFQDTPVTIGVMANDSDPERQGLSLADLIQPASGGSAEIVGTNVVFTPAPGFRGTTTFSYIVADTFGGTSTGLVTVVVIPLNHPPVANPGTFTMANTATLSSAVTASDADGDALTYSLVSGTASGTLTFTATGNFTYKPAANFSGSVSFTFRASDGALNSTATVNITVTSTAPVNNPPVAVNDTATVLQGGSVTISVLANDSDPNGDTLTITTATSANGTVVISSGKLVFTPTATFSGTATISYTISDGKGGTATATVTVTVTPKTVSCDIYPIALSWDKVRCVNPGQTISDIYNGNKPGNFGWLTWAGSPSTPTLVTSLGIPGNSYTYINPYCSSDHKLSSGDWVQGSPGVANSSNVRAALDKLKTIDIVVPVYDKSRCSGNNALFHVVAFAKVRILSYSLPGTNKITAKFIGFVDCNNDCNYRRDCDDHDDDDYDRDDDHDSHHYNSSNRCDHSRHSHDSKGRCRN